MTFEVRDDFIYLMIEITQRLSLEYEDYELAALSMLLGKLTDTDQGQKK